MKAAKHEMVANEIIENALELARGVVVDIFYAFGAPR